MGKIGKKTKKFVKKHLKTVIKNRRKFKSIRDSDKRKHGGGNNVHHMQSDQVVENKLSNGNIDDPLLNGVIGDCFFDGLLNEDKEHNIEVDSSSDGYLSEDPDCPYISGSEDSDDSSDGIGNNGSVNLELLKMNKKLNTLKKKDPVFLMYLGRHKEAIEQYSDEEGDINVQSETTDVTSANGKRITYDTLELWVWLVMESDQPNEAALLGLLNGYRTACHYCLNDLDQVKWQIIQNSGVYSKILMFMLSEADGIFRRILGISDSCSIETFLKLKNNCQFKTMKPFLKSYLRSTLFLLNQLTDSCAIAFVVSRLRVSVVFLDAFPLLFKRMIKMIVHLWATGEEFFLSSFLFIKETALRLGSNSFQVCLTKAYLAFISRCKFFEPENMKHIKNLGDSIVELYSLDVQKSYQKVLTSLQQLSLILQKAFNTKKKEEFERICSWQFIKCIDTWVKFISLNFKDYDLKPLLQLAIQIIKGITHFFHGLRYLPLRLKCVQMLNTLSSSSGVFIPVAYLVLDFIEYREITGNYLKQENDVDIQSVLKTPKAWLKSRELQEQFFHFSLELLSEHFHQWSYHISFPDLATIPLFMLKKFYQNVSVESLRRSVKRFIEQVEKNIEFVQKKRDELSFSVRDESSIETFLQMEKSSSNASFSVYYKSFKKNGSKGML